MTQKETLQIYYKATVVMAGIIGKLSRPGVTTDDREYLSSIALGICFDLPPVMTETKNEKRLKSIVCICLERKQKGKPFCRKCFTKLPDDLKQRLSNQLVEDFLVAYDEAQTQLQFN